ncbi:MAG TPA: hypothetical protein VL094_04325 [Sphingomonadaceae bacterium]|nr:hypothetical protein [Sphingomonadaceae bacterium]
MKSRQSLGTVLAFMAMMLPATGWAQKSENLSASENERYQLWTNCAGHMLFVQMNGKTYGAGEAAGATIMRPKIEAYIRRTWPQKDADISGDIDSGFRAAKERAQILDEPSNSNHAGALKFVETCNKIGGFVSLDN